MDWIFIAIGLLVLLFAGDALVRGAVSLSLKLGIPAFIVSLTVVAFGTSAPELLIAIQAATDGYPGLALGNVVGSNIANVLLVLGLPALLVPMATSQCETRQNYYYMMFATLVFYILCLLEPISRVHGFVLLALISFILWRAIQSAQASRAALKEAEAEIGEVEQKGWKIAVFLGLGLIGLPLGADLLVDHSVRVATRFGVSDTVIGLTIVAIGTSLPELATTVMAALRRQAEVALGNVIGSNIFNLLAVMGITALFAPIPIPHSFLTFDLLLMFAASALLIPFALMKQDLGRIWGAVFLAIYGVYLVVIAASAI